MQRIFIKNIKLPLKFQLIGSEYHHLIEVLRLTSGNFIEIVDLNGEIGLYQLAKINLASKTAEAIFFQKKIQKNELPIIVTLICALTKGKKIEETVEKGTEFGASNFIFYPSQYSPIKFSNSWAQKKEMRLNKIAISAAKQSHRTVIPKVHIQGHLSYDKLENKPKFLAYEKQVASESTLNLALAKLKSQSEVYCAFGPEGGWTPLEVKDYQHHGFQTISLGNRILRAENAPLFFLSVLSFYFEM